MLNKFETQKEIVYHIRLPHPETINSVSRIWSDKQMSSRFDISKWAFSGQRTW